MAQHFGTGNNIWCMVGFHGDQLSNESIKHHFHIHTNVLRDICIAEMATAINVVLSQNK